MARKMSEDFIGICQWCFGEYKVNDRRELVLHGYQRPGYGYTLGNCQGYRHAPFEYAHDLTEKRIALLHEGIAKNQRQIKIIDSGKITKVKNENYVDPQSPEWAKVQFYNQRSYAIEYFTQTDHADEFNYRMRVMRANIENEIHFDQGVVDYLQAAVDAWEKKDIVGLDSPATGRERFVRDAYDPEKAKQAEEHQAKKQAREAKPGKITVNVYGEIPFPDRNLPWNDADWRAEINKVYENEKAFKTAVKQWAKTTFTGKLWVGDGDDQEIRRATGKSDYGPGYKMECVAIRPEWGHMEQVMAMFPNAFRVDRDGNRDRTTMQCIGKGKDIRLWVDISTLPNFQIPKF